MRTGRALVRWVLGAALAGTAAAAWAADPAGPNPPGSNPSVNAPAPHHAQPLDLSAPPLNHVLSARELRELESEPDTSVDTEVEVDAGRYRTPVPNGFLHALPWAVMHPMQAWRVFTPVTEE